MGNEREGLYGVESRKSVSLSKTPGPFDFPMMPMFTNDRLAAIVWILFGVGVVALLDFHLIVMLLRGRRRFSVAQIALAFAVLALLWTAFSSTPVFWGRETTLLSKLVDIGVVVCIYTGLAVSPLAIERVVPWITGRPSK